MNLPKNLKLKKNNKNYTAPKGMKNKLKYLVAAGLLSISMLSGCDLLRVEEPIKTDSLYVLNDPSKQEESIICEFVKGKYFENYTSYRLLKNEDGLLICFKDGIYKNLNDEKISNEIYIPETMIIPFSELLTEAEYDEDFTKSELDEFYKNINERVENYRKNKEYPTHLSVKTRDGIEYKDYCLSVYIENYYKENGEKSLSPNLVLGYPVYVKDKDGVHLDLKRFVRLDTGELCDVYNKDGTVHYSYNGAIEERMTKYRGQFYGYGFYTDVRKEYNDYDKNKKFTLEELDTYRKEYFYKYNNGDEEFRPLLDDTSISLQDIKDISINSTSIEKKDEVLEGLKSLTNKEKSNFKNTDIEK